MSKKKYVIIIAAISVLLVLGALLLWNSLPKETAQEVATKTQEVFPSAEAEVPESAKPEPVEPKEIASEKAVIITPEPEKPAEESKKNPEKEASSQEETIPPQPEIENKEQELKTGPTCTLSVRCDDVFRYMEKLAKEKRAIIPTDGIMLPEQTVELLENESVFDVLLRVLKEQKIHLEFVENPMYKSVYIEGIGNLYEFDCGDTSGWIYTVNGKQPTYGCSQYLLQDGDKIEFFYRCSMFDD